MKAAKRISFILKVVGWVLIAVAVMLTVYNLANDSTAWKTLKTSFTNDGESLGALERVPFDHQYFKALIDAAGTKDQSESERVASVREYFTPWEKRLDEAEQAIEASALDEAYRQDEESFDAQGYIDFYEQLESSEDTRHIKQAIEYLDSVVKPAASKGKKAISNLTAASVEPDLETLYAAYESENGEDACSYLEYVEAIKALAEEDIAAGKTISDIKSYINSLDSDRFLAAVAAVKEQEREESVDIRDGFVEALEKFIAGDKGAIRAYEDALYEDVSARYDDIKINRGVFRTVFVSSIWDESFDGSYNTLIKQIRAEQEEYNKTSLDTWVNTYAKSVIETSDKSNSIAMASWLWFLAAHFVLIWLIAIVLLIVSAIVNRVTNKLTLQRLKSAGIEEDDDVLLRVEHLKQYFKSGDYINKAVDDVSFYIKKGEVFGLVGESGCGKTTTGRTIINLYDPTEGDVYFNGLRISSTQNGLSVLIKSFKNEFEAAKRQKLAELKEQTTLHPENAIELKNTYDEWLKAEKIGLKKRIANAKVKAMESSIEKSKCVEMYREKRQGELTREYERDMKTLSGEEAAQRKARYEIDMKVAAKDNVMTKMQMIFQDPVGSINPRMTVREIIAEGLKIRGITDEKYIDEKVYETLEQVGLVREHASRYPHEFSGGQKQRVGIARAIVLQPDLIIADEPISALDVSIQAQVINLLNELRDKMGLTIMFIAHNLSVVKYFSDRIGVMYYGHLVELTTSEELFAHPLHPYTKSLLSAIPYPDPYHEKYRKRIEYDPNRAHDYSVDKPSLREIKPGHFIRCNDAEFEQYKKELGI